MPTDRTQAEIGIGDPVKILGIVTSIGGTQQAPTVTINTDFKGFAGSVTAITVDAIQVIKDS